MILFLEDWKKHPTAIIHRKSANSSWLRLAGVYYKMGIKNYAMHTSLINPKLSEVDAHDENLSTETIAMIIKECKENYWYALREIIRVPSSGTSVAGPLRANRGNIALYWLYFNHVTTMLIQPRQTGKSVSVDALMIVIISIVAVNTDVNLLTKDDSLRVKNVKRIKSMMDELPFYLKLRNKTDSNNTEYITVNALRNTYRTSVTQSSKQAALNIGRGQTIATNHIDEIAHGKNLHLTLPVLLSSAGAARDSARENNSPYGTIMTTTPGYRTTKAGRFGYELYMSGLRWSERLLDCKDEKELTDLVRKNSRNDMVVIDINHRQLGYTDEWLKERIRAAISKGEDAQADFLNIWPKGSAGSPISKASLKIIEESKMDEVHTGISTLGYVIRWYITSAELEAYKNKPFIIGVDTSEACGGDDIGVVFRDITDGGVLGAGDYNETNTITFAQWLVELLVTYPKSILVIERKSTGISIIDHVINILVAKGIDPFTRLFNWVVSDYKINPKYKSDVIDVPMGRRDPAVYVKYRKQFGYTTSGGGRSSRALLYGEVFNSSIKYTAGLVRDVKLILQLTGLVVVNGRIDHDDGGSDDLVIAWLLGYWFLSMAENKEFYGLSNNMVLSTVSESMLVEQGGPEVIAKRDRQLKLKAEIDKLLSMLKKEKNSIKSALLVKKIRHLYKFIDTSVIKAVNINAVIDNITLERKKINTPSHEKYRNISI